MSIQDLQTTIILCSIVMIAAMATCFYQPKITVDLDMRDYIVLIGILSIGVGCYMIYPASAFIASGSLLFWIGRPR